MGCVVGCYGVRRGLLWVVSLVTMGCVMGCFGVRHALRRGASRMRCHGMRCHGMRCHGMRCHRMRCHTLPRPGRHEFRVRDGIPCARYDCANLITRGFGLLLFALVPSSKEQMGQCALRHKGRRMCELHQSAAHGASRDSLARMPQRNCKGVTSSVQQA